MSRIPPLPRSQLSHEQQEAYDRLSKWTDSALGDAFKSKDGGAESAMIGPFPFLLAQPQVGLKALDCLASFPTIPGFPAQAREISILATGAHWKGSYELYAHANNAVKKLGMDKDQIRQIVAGQKPKGLSEECSVAYDVATYLSSSPGPLRQDLWDRSVQTFGKDGTVALLHYVGFYAYICISMLNGIDAPVPEDESSVLL